jgi:hypothetical protein
MLPSRDSWRRQPWPASQLHAAAGTFKWSLAAAGIARAASYTRRMKPHMRRGRKAKEKRIERATARKAGQKQAA